MSRVTIHDVLDTVRLLAPLESDTYTLTSGAQFEALIPQIRMGRVGLYVDDRGYPRARLKKNGVTTLASGRAHLDACGIEHP